MVSLPLFDVTHVEQAGSVVRIFLQPRLEILASLIESSEVPVSKTHESIRARRRVQFDQCLELVDGLRGLPGHKIALAQRRAKIRALRSDL